MVDVDLTELDLLIIEGQVRVRDMNSMKKNLSKMMKDEKKMVEKLSDIRQDLYEKENGKA